MSCHADQALTSWGWITRHATRGNVRSCHTFGCFSSKRRTCVPNTFTGLLSLRGKPSDPSSLSTCPGTSEEPCGTNVDRFRERLSELDALDDNMSDLLICRLIDSWNYFFLLLLLQVDPVMSSTLCIWFSLNFILKIDEKMKKNECCNIVCIRVRLLCPSTRIYFRI